jgi:L-alanine-DL-glutamate epimerase-like enolase superfamily enzyme
LQVVIGHGFGLTLSTLAEAAVAATSLSVLPGCEAVGPLKMAGDVVREPVNLDNGVIRLSDFPGLGASVDPDLLTRYRMARRRDGGRTP